MNTKPFSPCVRGSNSILGIDRENQIFFLRTPATVKFFPQNCQKIHYSPRCICITNMGSPTLFPRGIIIFQGVLTKFNFLTKSPDLEKFVDLMKDLKYEHQSILPLWGEGNLILGIGRI